MLVPARTAESATPGRIKQRARILWFFGVLALALGGFTLLIVRVPYALDAIRYTDVDQQCRGKISLDSELPGLTGRHCFLGPDLLSTQSAGMAHLEYAADGHVFLWWGAEGQPALVRTPGGAGGWYCGTGVAGGHAGSEGKATISGLHPVQFSDPSSTDSLVAEGSSRNEELVLVTNGNRRVGQADGYSCLQGLHRCRFNYQVATDQVRLILRTENPMDGERPASAVHGFALIEHGWPVKSVDVRLTERASAHVGAERNTIEATLSRGGLCPADTPGGGKLELAWAR